MVYPVLNDPMARYGWGGFGVKINNFFPQQYGGDCGCGGRMQAWMFGMMAMNQVLGGIFNMFKSNDGQGAIQQTPAQMGMPMYGGMPMASTFYPYVNFQHAPYGDGLGGNSYNNTAVQQAKIKNLLQLPENKKLYSGIVTNPDGSGYLIKDKKSVPFSNLDELESMLQENVGKEVEDTEPEEDPDNKTKVKPDNKPETDPDNRVENDPDNKVETEPGNTVEAEDNGAAPKAETKKKFTYPKLNGNNTWTNYNKSNKKNDSIKVGMTVEELVKIIGPLPPYSIEGTIELYEKANPNAIKDGKIVDLNKLDIIVSTNKKKSDEAQPKDANTPDKRTMYGGTYFNSSTGKQIAGHTFKQGAQFAGNNGWYSEDTAGFWEDNGYLVINGQAYTLEGNNKGITVDFEDFNGFLKDKNGKMKFGGKWSQRYTLWKGNTRLKAEIYTKNNIAYLDIVTKDGKKLHYDLNEVMNTDSIKDFPL